MFVKVYNITWINPALNIEKIKEKIIETYKYIILNLPQVFWKYKIKCFIFSPKAILLVQSKANSFLERLINININNEYIKKTLNLLNKKYCTYITN